MSLDTSFRFMSRTGGRAERKIIIIIIRSSGMCCPKHPEISFINKPSHKQGRTLANWERQKLNVKTVIKVNLWNIFSFSGCRSPSHPTPPPAHEQYENTKNSSESIPHVHMTSHWRGDCARLSFIHTWYSRMSSVLIPHKPAKHPEEKFPLFQYARQLSLSYATR